MKISVLIGSRNRAHILKRCLKSVLIQEYGDFEVVVLDDASDNAKLYQQIIESFGDPRVRLIRSEKPLGVSGGRNVLMQHATGDVFFVIDDDAYFDESSSLLKVAVIFENRADVGIIACKIKNYGVDERPYRVPFKQKILKRDPEIMEKSQYVGYYLGGGHAIRKETVEICGGYSAELHFGEEEVDLSYRVISKGWKIWYEPSILIHHISQPSVVGKGRGYEELYHHVKNRFYLAWRYLPWRYMIYYLWIWMGKCFLIAGRQGFLDAYFKGIVAGLRALKNTPES